MHRFDEVPATTLVDILAVALDRLALDPVPLDGSATPEDLAIAAPSFIGEDGTSASEVLRVYRDVLAPAVISIDSPRYFSFIPTAPTKLSLLFDLVVSAASLNGISWFDAAGAVWAENQVLRFLCDQLRWPASAGGCFVSGGSSANLSALAVARDQHGGIGERIVLVSDQSHSSIANAAHLLAMELRVVPTRGRVLRGDAITEYVATLDVETRGRIAAVVATTGTTNLGLIDELESIVPVAQDNGWWVHVDGAYGLAGILSPLVSDRFRGIENADSAVVDPHKWLFAPFDCAALIYREPERARMTHRQHAAYLDPVHDTPERWNPSDYAHHLTRRARGLPLWFSLSVHGVRAYREAIEHSIRLASYAASALRAHPRCDLVCDPVLSVVAWTVEGWQAHDYVEWSERLFSDGIGFVLPSKVDGRTVLRMAFLHPDSNESMVDEVLATIR